MRTHTWYGFPIVASAPARKGMVKGSIIVADISAENPYDPFAVWWMRDEDGMTAEGSYRKNLGDAMDEYTRRLRREYALG